LHNNEFKIHLIGIGDDVNKQLIIDTSKAGNGSYNFIDDTSNLQNKIYEIINNCTKEYINNYNFILNDKMYELQPINKTTYINESMHYCYILKGNENKNFNIKFNYENLNQKFMKDMAFKSEEIYKLSEGEELSKLIIGSALKYNLEDDANLSKKYQVLSKSTSLYAWFKVILLFKTASARENTSDRLPLSLPDCIASSTSTLLKASFLIIPPM
jgi:hypothetical protein